MRDELHEHLVELYERVTKGVRLGLDRMRVMCAAFGNPQFAYTTILVAGTNGKGSVSQMWRRALLSAGHKVGTYTSPHLVHYSERIMLEDTPISHQLLVHYIQEIQRKERFLGFKMSFFEFTTLIAFLYFRDQKVKVAVLEVGLGGRMDATNVANPSVCVITSISLDHQEILGNTLEAIAEQKAGIARHKSITAVGLMPMEAQQQVFTTAKKRGAEPIIALSDCDPDLESGALTFYGQRYTDLLPTLQGRHQVANALCFALSAMMAKTNGLFGFTMENIRDGIRAQWPGRYQCFIHPSGTRIVLDGAHNQAGTAALVQTLNGDLQRRPDTLLVTGMVKRPDVSEVLTPLAATFKRVILTKPCTPRALEPEELLPSAPHAVVIHDPVAAIEQAIQEVGPQGEVVIAGSLYLVGDALAYFQKTRKDDIFDFK